jgi:hypothetical protein
MAKPQRCYNVTVHVTQMMPCQWVGGGGTHFKNAIVLQCDFTCCTDDALPAGGTKLANKKQIFTCDFTCDTDDAMPAAGTVLVQSGASARVDRAADSPSRVRLLLMGVPDTTDYFSGPPPGQQGTVRLLTASDWLCCCVAVEHICL